MDLSDTRIYRVLYIGNEEISNSEMSKETSTVLVKPYSSRYSYASDFQETIAAAATNFSNLADTMQDDAQIEELRKSTEKRIEEIEKTRKKIEGKYTAAMSMIHPYALIRLTGTNETGDQYKSNNGNWEKIHTQQESESTIFDKATRLRWYEVDARMDTLDISSDTASGRTSKHYAKSPTTKDLINWSTYDKMGRFPYSFQDFVFCKYWNKIENNRLITLRRYPAPVLDNVIPANYKSNSKADENGTPIYKSAFSPLVTAVTYFGEGTDNSIKDILKFTVGYNWSELTSDVHKTTSNQIEEGNIFSGTNPPYLSSGLGFLATMLGVMGDFNGTNKLSQAQIAGNPPDPYNDGPYENRVIGPVNVIMNVQKRERGLKFTQDSIVLTFDYIARPIANVNTKAILLDLMANILAMTYSSGMWFGGAHRYRVEHPAVYPWRNTSQLNKIYQGKLFGKEGAFQSIFKSFFNKDTWEFASNFASDLIDGIKAYAKDIVNAIKGGGKAQENESAEDTKERQKAEEKKNSLIFDQISGTAGRVLAAHLMKGANVPWLEGAKALLTGEPVGDWHITIGNPLNPIAMIGNLIVENCEFEFYDELGPDDFPIGFKARITLKHGMGRDKDAVESMFNRGNGRIYMLSDAFKSSADHETTVDKYTGENNIFKDKVKVQNWGALATTGSFAITNKVLKSNRMSQDSHHIQINYNPNLVNMATLSSSGIEVTNLFRTTPWAMHHIL